MPPLKALNELYLNLLQKEQAVQQLYSQNIQGPGKKHRMHEDIANDFLEDIDMYGFD